MQIHYILHQCVINYHMENQNNSVIDNSVSKYTIDYILNLDPYESYCYIFVLDMLYPSKLHDR